MKRVILIIFVGLLIIGCSTEYKSIVTQMPDLTKLNDGIYRGIYDLLGTPVKVTLDVNIQNNRILNIEIVEHNCSQIGKKAKNVIEKQSLEIDAVSGATASSKTILKAIENALKIK